MLKRATALLLSVALLLAAIVFLYSRKDRDEEVAVYAAFFQLESDCYSFGTPVLRTTAYHLDSRCVHAYG